MKCASRAKLRESEETIRKLEKKGERSRDCSVDRRDVYTGVSEHSAQRAWKDTSPHEAERVLGDALQLCVKWNYTVFMFDFPSFLNCFLFSKLSVEAFDGKKTTTWQRAIWSKQNLYWHWFADSASMSLSVCLSICLSGGPFMYMPRGWAWLLFVCFFCALPQFKVCCGNPRSSARAKRSRLRSWRKCRIRVRTRWKTSGRRRYEGEVEGLGQAVAQPPVSSPEPEEDFDSMRLQDVAASRQAQKYCCKKKPSFFHTRLYLECCFRDEILILLPWVNCVLTLDSSSCCWDPNEFTTQLLWVTEHVMEQLVLRWRV